jgi:hypothetical protein
VRRLGATLIGALLQLPIPGLRSLATAQSVPGSELTVSLLTFDPGGRVWERFGHNAIWLHDSATGSDALYDYGRFSFQRPHFILRFIQGRMWYSMGFETNLAGLVAAYAGQGRRIWSQELDLTPDQRAKLREFLEWNIRPEHAEYFYDYYRDNCSTRIRDALDSVMGGAIRRYANQASGLTWRDETRRLNQHNAALYSGLLVALGHPVDAGMSRWEQMFLPMRLRQHLDSVRIAGADGVLRPVVKAERMIAAGGRWPVPERPSSWLVGYLLSGLVLGGLLVALGRTRAFVPLAMLWALLAAVLGGLLAWFWLFSQHVATYRNENLLPLNLLSLGLLLLLPGVAFRRARALLVARRIALALTLLAVLGLLLKLLPWFRQHNLEVLALALPLHAGVWLGLGRRATGFAPS